MLPQHNWHTVAVQQYIIASSTELPRDMDTRLVQQFGIVQACLSSVDLALIELVQIATYLHGAVSTLPIVEQQQVQPHQMQPHLQSQQQSSTADMEYYDRTWCTQGGSYHIGLGKAIAHLQAERIPAQAPGS